MTIDEAREKYRKRLAKSVEQWEPTEPLKMGELRRVAMQTLAMPKPPASRLGKLVLERRYHALVAEYKGWPSEESYVSKHTPAAKAS